MKLFNTYLLVFILLLCATARADQHTANTTWSMITQDKKIGEGQQVQFPVRYLVFSLNTPYFKDVLSGLSLAPQNGMTITLPQPDGHYRNFRIWRTPVMPAWLATKYPEINTYTAVAADDQRVSAKIDFTLNGFHAMIFDGMNTYFIDPFNNVNDGYYIVHYKRDDICPPANRVKCDVEKTYVTPDNYGPPNGLKSLYKVANDSKVRTYRLALACDSAYAHASTKAIKPTKAMVLGAMVTTLNRVNGVYERELSVTMVLTNAEDTLIFIDSASDPFKGLSPSILGGTNQYVCDSLIGKDNYDIGHLFTVGGGGLSDLACVCSNGRKARSITGRNNPVGDAFDIDFVAHEMGHEFGANHPFNDNASSICIGNAEQLVAYEPGSGSTIMAYAGYCSPDNLQPHSDDYFHAANIREITTFIINGTGNTCAATSSNNNKPVYMPVFSAAYTIPYLTPFEFTAPLETDSVANTSNTFCWEQYNLGDFGSTLINTHKYGPIFRTFYPDSGRTRIFPRLDSILVGTTSYAGPQYDNKQGEKLPDSARYLTFKLTVRNLLNGYGCILTPDDTIHLDVINTGAPFTVTSPPQGYKAFTDSTMIVTWDLAGTNTPPINCSSVDIYLSTDGGHHFPYLLKASTPNDGADTVKIPAGIFTTDARIKVKGTGNVFFNISKGFEVDTVITTHPVVSDKIYIYPIPSNGSDIKIKIENSRRYEFVICNAIGQRLYKSSIISEASVNMSNYPPGIYFIHFIRQSDGSSVVKPFVIR